MNEPRRKPSCPICGGKNTDADGAPLPLFPFCSDRCKMIDLGKWLSGEYFERIPENQNKNEQEE